MYTAAAALFAAVIGLGSAVIAGWLDSSQSEEDFLRARRIDVYAEFISNGNQAYYALEHVRSLPVDPASSETVPSREDLEELQSLYVRLDGSMDEVAIVATEDVAESANRAISDIYAGLDKVVDDAGIRLPILQRLDGYEQGVPEGGSVVGQFGDYLVHREFFVRTVRDELGID